MTTINNRSELLFLYDIQHANPNGDPNDENKPRIDEETGRNIVTDVRLKRTIRDYLFENKKQEIFVREITFDDGTIQDGKTRAADFGKDRKTVTENVLEKCIDVRLFGSTIPLEKDSVTFTGPVQFKMGQSLHPVKIEYIKGTGAFASKPKSKQKTFREEYVVAYSLIAFHGIINENAAKHTRLTDNDVGLLIESIWNGTKGLISRSKFGQMPRLFIKVNYSAENFFIGDLDHLVKIKTDKLEEELRSPEDYKLDVCRLLKAVDKYNDKIDSVEFVIDDNFFLCRDDEEIQLEKMEKFSRYHI